ECARDGGLVVEEREDRLEELTVALEQRGERPQAVLAQRPADPRLRARVPTRPRPCRPPRVYGRAALLVEPLCDARLECRRCELFGFRVGDRDRLAVAAIELEQDLVVDESADAKENGTSHERFERIECVAGGRG